MRKSAVTMDGIVLILPATPDPVVIDEDLVSRMLGEYKSHFPTVHGRKKKETAEFRV